MGPTQFAASPGFEERWEKTSFPGGQSGAPRLLSGHPPAVHPPPPTHRWAGRLVAEALCALRQDRAWRPPCKPLRGEAPRPSPPRPCLPAPGPMPRAAPGGTSSGKGPSGGEWRWLLSLLGPRQSPDNQPLVRPWAGGAEEEAPGPGAPAGRGGKTAERRDREGTGPEEGPPPSAWLLTSLSIATACARAYVRA